MLLILNVATKAIEERVHLTWQRRRLEINETTSAHTFINLQRPLFQLEKDPCLMHFNPVAAFMTKVPGPWASCYTLN